MFSPKPNGHGSGVRAFGVSKWAFVITNTKQFEKAWPEFLKSIGPIPIVGMNCKAQQKNCLRALKHVKINVNENTKEADSDEDEMKKFVRTKKIYDFDRQLNRNDQEFLLKTRDINCQKGRIAMIQLSSAGGVTLLIRTCFFSAFPTSLICFLADNRFLKIGQGLERDIRLLQDSFGFLVSGYIDIRNIALRWPWFVRHFEFEFFGLKTICEFLFGNNHFQRVMSRTSANPIFIKKTIDYDQVVHTSCEVQALLDVAIFMLLRTHGLTLNTQWDQDTDGGRLLYYTAVHLCEVGFLDNSLQPARLRAGMPIDAEFRMNQMVLEEINRVSGEESNFLLAENWAWPLLRGSDQLADQISDSRDFGLSSEFVAVKEERLKRKLGHDKWRVCRELTLRSECGEFTLKIKIRELKSSDTKGAKGKGDPKKISTLFREGPTHSRTKILADCVEKTAWDSISSIKDKVSWNGHFEFAGKPTNFIETGGPSSLLASRRKKQNGTDTQNREEAADSESESEGVKFLRQYCDFEQREFEAKSVQEKTDQDPANAQAPAPPAKEDILSIMERMKIGIQDQKVQAAVTPTQRQPRQKYHQNGDDHTQPNAKGPPFFMTPVNRYLLSDPKTLNSLPSGQKRVDFLLNATRCPPEKMPFVVNNNYHATNYNNRSPNQLNFIPSSLNMGVFNPNGYPNANLCQSLRPNMNYFVPPMPLPNHLNRPPLARMRMPMPSRNFYSINRNPSQPHAPRSKMPYYRSSW